MWYFPNKKKQPVTDRVLPRSIILPFSYIGCDSEGLTWNFMDESMMNLGLLNQNDFLTSTSGFIITDDSGQEKVQTASIILDVNSDPSEQVQKLIQSGFEPKSSWGIALSSSLRG